MSTNGVELEVEAAGEGEPLVLIMGIGSQLVMWPDGLVAELIARGFRVIRFDHRDIGRSTWLDHLGVPHLPGQIGRWALGRPVRAPYTLDDMADDVAGLISGLGLADAHVLGVSMGGMVAQVLALRHPSRVRTLTSIMSHPGDRRSLLGRPAALAAILSRSTADRAAVIQRTVNVFKVLSGPRMPLDEAGLRELAGLSYDRGYHPQGFQRQAAAILAAAPRTERLRSLRAPTLVMHGSEDPLILPACGRATAAAIPGARYVEIAGMGHSLPPEVWSRIAGEAAALAGA